MSTILSSTLDLIGAEADALVSEAWRSLVMLLAATLGWFVQAIGVVAVVFIVVLVKRFGKYEAQLAATLYHLAMANYRLAEASNDRTRPVDALRFMRRCATIRSPFQEQAVRNVESIKSEYNLP